MRCDERDTDEEGEAAESEQEEYFLRAEAPCEEAVGSPLDRLGRQRDQNSRRVEAKPRVAKRAEGASRLAFLCHGMTIDNGRGSDCLAWNPEKVATFDRHSGKSLRHQG